MVFIPADYMMINYFDELAFCEDGFDEEESDIFVNNFEQLAFFESGFDGEMLKSYVAVVEKKEDIADDDNEEDWEAEIAIYERELETRREMLISLERKERSKALYKDALLKNRLGPNARVRRESMSRWRNSSKLATIVEMYED